MGKLTFSSIRGIRVIRGSILPLIALVFFFPFSSSAKAQSVAMPGLDGLDCITAYELAEDTTQVCDNSPTPRNDLEEISLPADNTAVIPSRYDQGTPRTTSTTLDPITLRRPGIIPAFLFSAYSSDSLREQIRERAPPVLA
jgi:hypothetical protein